MLDVLTKSQIKSLRKNGLSVLDICQRLGITRPAEIKEASELCAQDKSLRRYQFGIEVGGPVKQGRNPAHKVSA